MPTTSNFGWTTPADTDLVKDGAAAIRTLGNGIDTSLLDLKGGTTGQVLSKNSNTDLDYTWVTPNVGDITEVQAGTGISVASGTGPIPVVTNSMATEITAKGDLIVGTGSGTFDNLAVGTNGHTLVADSSTSTGLKWAAPSSGALTLITTTTFTAANTIAIDSVFSSTYDNYKVIVVGGGTTANQPTLELQMRASGTATASNYKTQEIYASSTTLAARLNLYGTTKFFLGELTNAVDDAATISFEIFSPYLADRTNIIALGTKIDGPLFRLTSGGLNDSTVYDGFEIDFDYTATGIVSVYGYSKQELK